MLPNHGTTLPGLRVRFPVRAQREHSDFLFGVTHEILALPVSFLEMNGRCRMVVLMMRSLSVRARIKCPRHVKKDRSGAGVVHGLASVCQTDVATQLCKDDPCRDIVKYLEASTIPDPLNRHEQRRLSNEARRHKIAEGCLWRNVDREVWVT